MSIDNSYNFRRVSDALTTSGVVGAGRLKGLAAEGYRAVINLLPDDSKYALADEAGIVTAQGLRYDYIPVDFAAPSDADYAAFCTAMQACPGKLHIHCAANYRVSLFYALYAVSEGLWDKAQAVEFVLDLWDPRPYPGWAELFAQLNDEA